MELAVDAAGVISPDVDAAESSGRGVAAPLFSWVAIVEASFRTASPRMVLMFLFRR